MFNNYAFHQPSALTGHPETVAQTETQATISASPSGGFNDSMSPNTIMTICLTPFCIAFLLFAVHLIRSSIRLNRGIKRLQHVVILERALDKTPDECS
jgi:hypothetical protein